MIASINNHSTTATSISPSGISLTGDTDSGIGTGLGWGGPGM